MESTRETFFETAKKVSERINLSLDAVIFIILTKRKKGCSSEDIVRSVIRKACFIYGKKARERISRLGITSGSVIGQVIYAYIREGLVIEEPQNNQRQFDEVYNTNDTEKLFSYYFKIAIIKHILYFLSPIVYSIALVMLFLNVKETILMIPAFCIASVYTGYLYIKKVVA